MRNVTKMPAHLRNEWHPTKNSFTDPDHVALESKTKLWWKCEALGHEWEARIDHRMHGSKCPICAGRQILPGFNDIASQYPEILKEWHPTKNLPLLPTQVGFKSDKYVWLTSPTTKKVYRTMVKHRIEAIENERNKANKTFESLEKQFHPEKNKPITFTEAKDNETYWWKCEALGHEWEAQLGNKKRWASKCPICTNRKILPGFNDLTTTHPQFASEWHPTKNTLDITEVGGGTKKAVWWKCKKGHEWEVSISDRLRKSYGCPECSYRALTSASENILVAELKKMTTVITSNRKILKGLELDVYLPHHNLGIEFNGVYWHSTEAEKPKSYHALKYKRATQAGINLLYIWEHEWNTNSKQIFEQIKLILEGTKTKPKADQIRINNGSLESLLLDLDEYHVIKEYSPRKVKHPKYSLWDAGSKLYIKSSVD